MIGVVIKECACVHLMIAELRSKEVSRCEVMGATDGGGDRDNVQ